MLLLTAPGLFIKSDNCVFLSALQTKVLFVTLVCRCRWTQMQKCNVNWVTNWTRIDCLTTLLHKFHYSIFPPHFPQSLWCFASKCGSHEKQTKSSRSFWSSLDNFSLIFIPPLKAFAECTVRLQRTAITLTLLKVFALKCDFATPLCPTGTHIQ